MPQQPQQKKDDTRDRVRTAANVALGASIAKPVVKDILARRAFNAKVAGTGVPNPKLDPQTGKKLPITSPVRATQTQAQLDAVKKQLFNQAAREAIAREMQATKGTPIGRAFTNARISMGGSGTPVTAAWKPGERPKVSADLKKELKSAGSKARDAKTMADLRTVVEEMEGLGKNSILGIPISPKAGAAFRGVINSPIVKGLKKAGPFIGGAVQGAEYLWSSNEAKNFATGKANKAPAGTTTPASAPKPDKAATPKFTDENLVIDQFHTFADQVDRDPYIGSNQKASEQVKLMTAWLKKNPQYIPAYNNSKKIQDAIKAAGGK